MSAQPDLREFRNALGAFATGVTVITTRGPKGELSLIMDGAAGETVPVTCAPRRRDKWVSKSPTPPAAACTRHHSPPFMGYVEFAR